MAYLTVIEIDSQTLKIVHAQGDSRGFLIEKVLTAPIAELTPQEVTVSINRQLNHNNIKVDKLIALISRRDVTLRILSLPSTDKKELEQMLSFEAVKQIPFPQEDIVFDYRVMDVNQIGYSQVMLAIAHKNVINRTLNILNKAGLRPDIITLTTEGLYLWSKNVLNQEIKTKKALLIMDIDVNRVEMEIVSGKKILLSRVSSFGETLLVSSNPEHQDYRERLLVEIKRSVDVYNKEQKNKLPIEKLIVTGSGNIARIMGDLFKDRLGLDVTFIESAATFSLGKNALIKAELPESVSIASTVGAVFAIKAGFVNMLPLELKRKQKFIQQSRKAAILLVLIISALAMLTAGVAIKFYRNRILLNNIEASVKKISPIAEEIKSKFNKLEMIQRHKENSKKPLTFLYELHKVIPKNILLNYLSLNKKGRIILQGTTPAMSDVFKFVNSLEKSKIFKNVETRYVSKRRLKNRETVDFQITCELSI